MVNIPALCPYCTTPGRHYVSSQPIIQLKSLEVDLARYNEWLKSLPTEEQHRRARPVRKSKGRP